jgi:hypothetical protein
MKFFGSFKNEVSNRNILAIYYRYFDLYLSLFENAYSVKAQPLGS